MCVQRLYLIYKINVLPTMMFYVKKIDNNLCKTSKHEERIDDHHGVDYNVSNSSNDIPPSGTKSRAKFDDVY